MNEARVLAVGIIPNAPDRMAIPPIDRLERQLYNVASRSFFPGCAMVPRPSVRANYC